MCRVHGLNFGECLFLWNLSENMFKHETPLSKSVACFVTIFSKLDPVTDGLYLYEVFYLFACRYCLFCCGSHMIILAP